MNSLALPNWVSAPASTKAVRVAQAVERRQRQPSCGSGKRSLDAANRRLAGGATRAAHLGGGLAAWKAEGLPVVRDARPGAAA